ncbi:hypothetical protein GHK86_02230 [Acidimicrobiaceae bacterium USS-CC1]|uniref:GNAT family N-acetyltransferase n=1 Tax=Acidiferrimicrobium australe TaxID=2664430 RepID=A0ABW9QPD9_9ACTN|nr:hypothetical protein [Acidiferrimicrobium australe]
MAPDALRRLGGDPVGLAREALRLASGAAFAGLALRRVTLYHAVGNIGSCGVATGAGYRLEGVLRASHRYPGGSDHDEHVHGRLAADAVPA